jgi:outer membrane protein TolC
MKSSKLEGWPRFGEQRGAGRFAKTALLKIARRSLEQSWSSFEAEVNDAIFQAVSQYWSAVQARGALDVQQKSLKLAQASYDRDKRSLELGAETNFFVLDAQIGLAQAELVLLQTQVNYQIALAAVGHSTANLLAPYHVQIAELAK